MGAEEEEEERAENREGDRGMGDQELVYITKVSCRKNTIILCEGKTSKGTREEEGESKNKQIRVAVGRCPLARPQLLVWRRHK